MSTTKQTANGERCSRILRRRSSGHLDRRPAAAARPPRGGSRRRRDRVARPPRRWRAYLPLRAADERARAPSDRGSLDRVAPARSSEDAAAVTRRRSATAGVPLDQVDGRSSVPGSPPRALFFRRPRSSSASSSAARARAASSSDAGRTDRAGSRWPRASSPASTTSPGSTRRRGPASAASAFAHWSTVTSARWLATPTPQDQARDGARRVARERARRRVSLRRACELARASRPASAAKAALERRPGRAVNASRRRIISARAAGGRPGARPRRRARAVGELRPQLALLRVHRADEQEARRMGDRDPLALDDVDAERRRVEQDVAEMVVEQVDLVDVEDPPVRLGEQAGLERAARPPRAPARCRSSRRRGPRWRSAAGRRSGPAPCATAASRRVPSARGRRRTDRRVAGERAVGDDLDLRQELGERRGRRSTSRFRSAPRQEAADRRVDGVERSARSRRSWSTIAVKG